MDDKYRKIYNAALKDAGAAIKALPGNTISRKMAAQAIRSCKIRRDPEAVILKIVKEG